MKKTLHYILSYVGAFLLFSGITGTLLKWSTMCLFQEFAFTKQIIIAIIAFSCGLFATIKFYKPLKYNQ